MRKLLLLLLLPLCLFSCDKDEEEKPFDQMLTGLSFTGKQDRSMEDVTFEFLSENEVSIFFTARSNKIFYKSVYSYTKEILSDKSVRFYIKESFKDEYETHDFTGLIDPNGKTLTYDGEIDRVYIDLEYEWYWEIKKAPAVLSKGAMLTRN